MASAKWEVQVAALALLEANTTLAGIVSGIFDDGNVPAGQALPYSVFGENTAVPFDSFDAPGREVTITLHTWSVWKGKKEAESISDEICTTLSGDRGVRLDLDNWSGTLVWDTSNIHEDTSTNVKTAHAVDRFRIKARKKV